MMAIYDSRRFSRWAAAAMLICGWLVLVGMAQATAAEPSEELAFDPFLSLTGDCSTSEIDPVPDPGCPGGVHPPAGVFTLPKAIATDSFGDVYIASYGSEAASGEGGRIDVFDSSGKFLTELSGLAGPRAVVVDSKGNLYVFLKEATPRGVRRYEPSTYDPLAGEVVYEKPPQTIVETANPFDGMAIDLANDHLFLHQALSIQEFSSAEDGNEPLDTIGAGIFNDLDAPSGVGLAVDSTRGRIYASDHRTTPTNDFIINVFELEAPHDLIKRIDGSATPAGEFHEETSITVDEDSGDLFLYPVGKVVYRVTKDGDFVTAIDHGFKDVFRPEIGFDNGAASPNKGYLFVPSHPAGTGHSFAFGPREACPPEITSASFANVTEGEAELTGAVKPCGLETAYAFEYTTRQSFEAEGFAGAQVAKQGQLAAGAAPVPVAAALSGLSPETAYRFRLSADNELGTDEAEGEFTTYPSAEPQGPCPNDALRTGLSALLPDCRAYELVTPPETNARAPRGVGVLGPYFATREASPAGDRLSFLTEGGALAGEEGTGSLGGDPYLSKREATGWSVSPAGPSGGEAVSPLPGGVSPDQGYSFWSSGSEGTAAIEARDTSYVRYPNGQSVFVGRGSLRDDPRAEGELIAENGSHIIFVSLNIDRIDWTHEAVPLEPNSPPEGTKAVYDRTADEVTHVVSLLPGDETPKAGENATYVGASLDGKGVAFKIGSTLYLRYNDEETFEIGEGVTFAGVAEGGARIFYLEGGKLLRFDALSEEVKAFNATGTAVPVNISADGSTAYFVSTAALTSEPNPNGAKAKITQQNLYRSEEGAISFVGIVSGEDVTGEETGIGLGRWAPHVVSYGEAAEDPSRSTPDGGVLLFESRADLTGYESEGQAEVYRYDANSDELTCLSCNPTGALPSGGATLQSTGFVLTDLPPLSPFARVANLRADGRRAFFESPDRLVPTDTDGLQDVYEWEAQGVGSCTRAGGCVYLISSGQSARVNYLYAVSDSGDDVFFRSSDLLVPADLEETPSIYDARVGGGFPEGSAPDCEGEGCRPVLPAPPPLNVPESGVRTPEGKPKVCPKGKRRVRRHGKAVCVKKKHHKKHKHHKKAGKSKGEGK